MIELIYKSPHNNGWSVIYAKTIPEVFEALQKKLEDIMRDNEHISVYMIEEIKIRYYRKDPRKTIE